MNTNNNANTDNDLVLEPLVYEPTVGEKPGKFIELGWDLEPKPNGTPVKDLFLKVELEEKDELGHPVQLTHRFNMLPRGRGLSDYKKQMESFLGRPLTRLELAQKPDRSLVVGKPVVVVYKVDHLNHVVFEKFLSQKAAQPAEVKQPTEVSKPMEVNQLVAA